mmetsp:Transcript_12710/g.53759  ORF Transcript_12710/g.53759 Transcript_12710/m.53759 type:complete len:386 (+) Transcript_12710:7231-8388(+)
MNPPTTGPNAAPARTAAWLAPSTRARLDRWLRSASVACAPAAYAALPAPATNLQKKSSGSPPHSHCALPSIPAAVIRGPATMRGLRPRESASAPKGTLSTSLARANALRVAPTCAADAPNSSANMGKTGATHEWPAMSSAVVTQMPATRLFSPRNPATSHIEESECTRGPVGAPASATGGGDDDDDDDDERLVESIPSASLHRRRGEPDGRHVPRRVPRQDLPRTGPGRRPPPRVGRRRGEGHGHRGDPARGSRGDRSGGPIRPGRFRRCPPREPRTTIEPAASVHDGRGASDAMRRVRGVRRRRRAPAIPRRARGRGRKGGQGGGGWRVRAGLRQAPVLRRVDAAQMVRGTVRDHPRRGSAHVPAHARRRGGLHGDRPAQPRRV